MPNKLFTFLLLIVTCFIHAQNEKKTIQATRINTPPKIDGILNDSIWQVLPAHGDFSMFAPDNGKNEPETHRTEIKMAYDDKAVYFAAYMYDDNPNNILRQFSQRDDTSAQADLIAININTLNDGINQTVFYVTSAGTIADSRVQNGNEDYNYNVVFQANISFDNKGWYAEFKIPYNALRFPEVAVQNWGVNFFRKIIHRNESYTWNYINRSVGLWTQYNGLVENLKDIDPPFRLILFPFTQGTVSNFDGDTETDFSAGMDIKYGLSDSFTLDATLIPDFGQAAFDNVALNLGPFEQVFSENRQFFTEGIELFNKGGLFFSRRVGGAPTGNADDLLEENEEVIDNPSKIDLLNALKISGRTKNNLGIGFFNGITAETEAKIRNTITGDTRSVVIEPISNYNIFVLDQQFNQNSSITLINTNVTRSGSFRDANVTGLLYDIYNKSNSYRFEGGARLSRIKENGTVTTGLRTNLEFQKTKGNFRWFLGHFMADDNYDSNDLGVLFRNNFNNIFGRISYQIFKPTKTFNEYRIALRASHRRLFKPSVVTQNFLDAEAFFATPKRFSFGANIRYNTEEDDYFEPRVDGRFVTFSSNVTFGGFVSTDYRKKFAFDTNFQYWNWSKDPQTRFSVFVSPRYRFSDSFLLVWGTRYTKSNKNFGFIENIDDDVFLGQRDITSIENTLQASYNFDSYKALNLRFRNFWSTADYSDDVFFILNNDGSRSQINYDTSENNPNTNFNIWNLDLSFNWRFAPGSEAILLYRNAIFNNDDFSTLNYSDSLKNLFEQPIRHTLSLRIVYFLDVNNVKNAFKG
ncbi:DUF5916 domain-containing protein [Leptobacterium sp. I13]|uniref:DUF5916 domain-containing protein n=1 Tax=Leptobacterium meishanense TaxID=3128904 RepID=UPI0030EE6635